MYFLKLKDFINLPWRLDKDILEAFSFTWTFTVTHRKRISSLMDRNIVSKIFTTLNAESFPNSSKIFIQFLALRTPISKLVKVKRLPPELICYGN